MSYTLYKIYYKVNGIDTLAYIGRTKQPLQNRIRGHVFGKAMHRSIDIEEVSKIEYTECDTEADMNLYEIYLILTLKPFLNIDDTTKDYPTVTLPEKEFKNFKIKNKLWEKWKIQINEQKNTFANMYIERENLNKEKSLIRNLHKTGKIDENFMEDQIEIINKKLEKINFGIKNGKIVKI